MKQRLIDIVLYDYKFCFYPIYATLTDSLDAQPNGGVSKPLPGKASPTP